MEKDEHKNISPLFVKDLSDLIGKTQRNEALKTAESLAKNADSNAGNKNFFEAIVLYLNSIQIFENIALTAPKAYAVAAELYAKAAYCFEQMQDYVTAARYYKTPVEQLTKLAQNEHDFKYNSLLKNLYLKSAAVNTKLFYFDTAEQDYCHAAALITSKDDADVALRVNELAINLKKLSEFCSESEDLKTAGILTHRAGELLKSLSKLSDGRGE